MASNAFQPTTFSTHTVHNTCAPFENVNLYACDVALQAALHFHGGGAAQQALLELGTIVGQAQWQELARQANTQGPRLQPYNRQGERIDEIEFHPAWHHIQELMIKQGAHAAPWLKHAGGHVARAAAYILFGQLENGAQCPVTMTFAAMPALRHAPQLAQVWLPKITSLQYDPRSLPVAQKNGAMLGMGMTEKQGGSDVRANTTMATYTGEADAWGERYRIVGHKWFFSAPQCDAHLILAQTDEGSSAGLTCFFLPRYLPDGSRNAIHVQRLKDKLGNRSNASSEVEFCGAIAYPLGPIGRGVATIMEMGGLTRLDCVLGTAGIMRGALTHALHHARSRQVFGQTLVNQALMQNVLADLALESEAATLFAMRLAHCFDHNEDALGRLLTAAGKYWLCKRGPTFGAEAMEVLGGNGYVEDAPLARWYREFPVNSIWEGSGNVMCLDVLRVLQKGPEPAAALAELLQQVAGRSTALDAYAEQLLLDIANLPLGAGAQILARDVAMRIVLAVQAALLLQISPAFVAQAFIASRLTHGPAACFGHLPAGLELAAILERALT